VSTVEKDESSHHQSIASPETLNTVHGTAMNGR
jgi:hypothetical protein